ncbi:MAG: type II toxin-antitoxin system VapC family toxin, partial [Chloroflexi bacterium]|nr:type II toxin-antitoxin system VapC family toxin [Chloroflexota bacterium]
MNLEGIERLFLDTAPLIYYVEGNERYLDVVLAVFERIDRGFIRAYTSPVTLAECLVLPYRKHRAELAQRFYDRIVNGRNTTYVPLDPRSARKAGELRAHYNLLLDDAFQLAAGLVSGCDAFLTNDRALKRVKEINVLVLEEM